MKKTLLILLAIVSIFSIKINAQTGSNIDFSLGDYTNWKAYQAQNLSFSSTISFSAWTLFNDPTTCFWQGERCFIINSNPNEIDSSVSTGTNVLKKIPSGYSSSSQINCAQNNSNTNKLSYDLSVTSQNCNITFNYALVFESPGHSGYENPFFIIEVRNINSDSSDGGLINPNAKFVVIGGWSASAGWNTIGNVNWKNWSQVSMNLQDYIGQTVRINYILASCTYGGHFGYGYVTTKVNPIYNDTIITEICEGETYNQFGFNESATGFYTQNLQTIEGFDSIVNLSLVVNPISLTTYYDTICQGNIYNGYGFSFTADTTGRYTRNMQTLEGCDSIVNLSLLVNPIYNDTIISEICQGQTYSQFGFNENTAGFYTLNLQTIKGCDSVVTLNLIVNQPAITNLTAEICQGEVYTLNGFNVNTAGLHTQNLQTIKGCDSTVNLTLTINQPAITNLTAEICQGEVYTLNGFNVSTAGLHTQNLQTIKGCDSTVNLTLTVNQPVLSNLTAEICQGEVYTLNGFNVTTAGLHTQNLQTIKGCDSTVNLTLTVNQPAITNLTAEICQGEVYMLNGFNASTVGLHTLNLQTTKGCDSTVNLTLTVNQPATTNLTAEICQGEVYTLNGFNVNTAGLHTINLQTIKGCDSTVNLSLVVNSISLTTYYDTICQGNIYNGYGFSFTADTTGRYTRNMQTLNGCDSIIALYLTVKPTPIVPEGLDVQVRTNFIELNWQDNGSTYIIYRNNDSLTTTTMPIYLDYDVVNEQPYCYKVKSINGDCESAFTNMICKTYLGIDNIQTNNITTKLYPNPTEGKAKLEVEGLNSDAEVMVYDMIGRVVQKHTIHKGNKELDIDLSGYAKGVYSIRIMNDSINQTKKLIVQ